MNKMEDTVDDGVSRAMSLGWDTIATASWGVIGAMGLFIVWLSRLLGLLLFNNWKKGRDDINKRIELLEKNAERANEVIYFTDLIDGKKTNIRRYMVHQFNNQKFILDNIISDNVEDRELLNEIKKLLTTKKQNETIYNI